MFIKEGSEFPPSNWSFWMDKFEEYKVWYSGESDDILRYYDSKINFLNERIVTDLFWAKLKRGDDAVHLPAVGDICSTSADLLFAELPQIKMSNNFQSSDRITKFIEENGLMNTLLEEAELTAAFGGICLKLDIDSRLSNLPIVSILTPLNFFPTFLRGRLWEVLFYREVKSDISTNVIYRLFENRKRYEKGFVIEFKLYKGSNEKIGKVIDLNSIEETENLNLKDQYIQNVDNLGCVYIPNTKPNKIHPGFDLGANDFNGCIPLLHSLDLSWTSLIRDIELGMGQIFIDEELLQREETSIFGTNQTYLNEFSKFQKSFLKLNLSNYKMSGDNIKPIDVIQFEMRIEEHLKACENIYKTIVCQCGYSASTFGLDNQGRAESGTALRIRERKSFLTRNKKARYQIPAIKQLLIIMQQLDNSINTIFYNVDDTISIELEDSIIIDPNENSNVIKNLDQAKAISTYLKVKMQHPEWSEKDLQNEVKRINDDSLPEEINIFDKTKEENLSKDDENKDDEK